MRLQWIQDLALLAETGSFSRAAERAASSQPAFSRRIQAFEAWAGVPLVERGRAPVTLSSGGEQLLEAGLQALTRLNVARDQVREAMAQPDRYVVTFGAQHSIGWRFYPNWLQAFEDDFGPLLSRLRADNLPDCFADLARGAVDFVMAYDGGESLRIPGLPATQSLAVGHDRLVPVAKTGGNGEPIFSLHNEEPIAIPYLRFGTNAPLGWHVEDIVTRHALAPRLRPVYENAMSGALRMRVREGLGLAWLPYSLVEAELDDGLLSLAGSQDLECALTIRLYRVTTGGNALTDRIWEHVKAHQLSG